MVVTLKPTRRAVLAGSAAGGAGLFAPAVLRAQDKLGSKPIRIISSLPPGGLTDAFARAYGDYIGEKLGQPAIVENKAGGGGWLCLLGPAGLPDETAERLSQLCVEAGKTERVRKILDTFGIDDAAMSRQTLKKFYDEEGPIWIEHARALNLTPQ